jgi:alkylhydroperoxidase family enzyme
MPARPNAITPEEADNPSVKERLEEAETNWYGDSAFFGAMAHCPEIFENIVTTFESFGQGERVDADLMELMRLKVAEMHQCAYCATVRTLEVRETVKPQEDAVFGEIDEGELTQRAFLAVSLAEYLSEDPHRMTDDFFEDLQDVFSEAEIIELLLFTSLEVGLDRFCIALELQPTDDSAYPDVEYPLENPRPKTE